MTFYDELVETSACKEALEWVEQHHRNAPARAYRECHRADWMLWFLMDADFDYASLRQVVRMLNPNRVGGIWINWFEMANASEADPGLADRVRKLFPWSAVREARKEAWS